MNENTPMAVTTCDTALTRLQYAHTVNSVSLHKLAASGEFEGIPAGTLSTILKTGNVPHKWHRRFGIRETKPAPVCFDCGEVHALDHCPKKPKPPRTYTRWADMPVTMVKQALMNREVWNG